jgi:hypothetical protein
MKTQHLFLLSGFGYFLIFLTGIYSNFMVVEPFIQGKLIGDVFFETSTGLASFFLTACVDALLAFSLFAIFRSINKGLAAISMSLRLFHALIFGVALALLATGIQLQVTHVELSQFALSLYKMMWDVGLLFFAIHLGTMGYLMIQSGAMPKWIGIALMLAGISYLLDSGSRFLGFTDEKVQEIVTILVIAHAVIGEFIFTVWLIRKGTQKG